MPAEAGICRPKGMNLQEIPVFAGMTKNWRPIHHYGTGSAAGVTAGEAFYDTVNIGVVRSGAACE